MFTLYAFSEFGKLLATYHKIYEKELSGALTRMRLATDQNAQIEVYRGLKRVDFSIK